MGNKMKFNFGEIQTQPNQRKLFIEKELEELYRCRDKKQQHLEQWKGFKILALENELDLIKSKQREAELENACINDTKEIERLKSEAKKDHSDYFGRYQKLVKENDILIEKLAIKHKVKLK